jgi:hypothetical protein
MTPGNYDYELGCKLLRDHATAGDSCLDALRQAARHYGKPSSRILSGAVSQAAGYLDSIKARGIQLPPMDERSNELLRGHMVDVVIRMNELSAEGDILLFAEYVTAIGRALDAARGTVIFLPPGSPPPATPDTGPRHPQEVRVVGLPERIRETVITRDAEGEITSSSQVERDLIDA